MTDELDVLSRLVEYHDHIAPPMVPVADDVRRGRGRVRRTRGIVTGAKFPGTCEINFGQWNVRSIEADGMSNDAAAAGAVIHAHGYQIAPGFETSCRNGINTVVIPGPDVVRRKTTRAADFLTVEVNFVSVVDLAEEEIGGLTGFVIKVKRLPIPRVTVVVPVTLIFPVRGDLDA